MESIGETLRKARQERKVDLEEASKKTKIHINILRALEENRFEGLNPVYVKGFLKIYGQYLGLKPEELIQLYQTISLPKKEAPIKEIKPVSPKPPFKLPQIFNFYKKINFRAVVIVIVAVLLFLGLTTAIRKHRQNVISKKSLTRLEPIATKPQAKKISQPKQEVVTTKPVTVKPPAPKQVATVPVKAALRAKEDTWVQVKLDGKLLFQGMLKKGRSQSWEAKQSIEMSIGNAGTVELEVSGKLLSPLGRRGQALKQVLINKEGLSIK